MQGGISSHGHMLSQSSKTQQEVNGAFGCKS